MADQPTPNAYLAHNERPRRPSLLCLVDDPADAEIVAVWWRLDRPRRFRCSEHGWVDSEPCQHVRAAAPLLTRHLLGDNVYLASRLNATKADPS